MIEELSKMIAYGYLGLKMDKRRSEKAAARTKTIEELRKQVVIVYDGKAPYAAAQNLAKYMREKGYKATVCDREQFRPLENEPGLAYVMVIIIGHHDFTKGGSKFKRCVTGKRRSYMSKFQGMSDEYLRNSYVPDVYQPSIYAIDYQKVKDAGIQFISFDIDDTIADLLIADPPKEAVTLFENLKGISKDAMRLYDPSDIRNPFPLPFKLGDLVCLDPPYWGEPLYGVLGIYDALGRYINMAYIKGFQLRWISLTYWNIDLTNGWPVIHWLHHAVPSELPAEQELLADLSSCLHRLFRCSDQVGYSGQ